MAASVRLFEFPDSPPVLQVRGAEGLLASLQLWGTHVLGTLYGPLAEFGRVSSLDKAPSTSRFTYRIPPVLVPALLSWHARLVDDEECQRLMRAHLAVPNRIATDLRHVSRWDGPEPCLEPQLAIRRPVPPPLTDLHDRHYHRDLFPFQRVGVDFLLRSMRAINADPMGLGKTVQVAAALEAAAALQGYLNFRCLIIAPKSMVKAWAAEGQRWAPGVTFRPVLSTRGFSKAVAAFRSEGGALVLSWGMVGRKTVLPVLRGLELDGLVLDEAHYAKNPAAQRTAAVMGLSYRVEYVWLLSGTPMRNRPADLWALLHMIDPWAFPTFAPFGERYCGAKWVRQGMAKIRIYRGAVRLNELRTKILNPCSVVSRQDVVPDALSSALVLRRRKDEVLDLPPKTLVEVAVDFQAAEGRAGAQLRRSYTAQIQALGDIVNAAFEVARGGGPGLTEKEAEKMFGMISKLRQIIGLAKVPAAITLINRAVADGEPLVVFFEYSAVKDLLVEHLSQMYVTSPTGERPVRWGSIVGSTSATRRFSNVEAFQAGELDVLLCSQAAKEGITLTRGSLMIRVDHWWTPGDTDQANDRIYRIGQTRAVTIVTLHLPGTFDDYMRRVQDRKSHHIATVLGDPEPQASLPASGSAVLNCPRALTLDALLALQAFLNPTPASPTRSRGRHA